MEQESVIALTKLVLTELPIRVVDDRKYTPVRDAVIHIELYPWLWKQGQSSQDLVLLVSGGQKFHFMEPATYQADIEGSVTVSVPVGEFWIVRVEAPGYEPFAETTGGARRRGKVPTVADTDAGSRGPFATHFVELRKIVPPWSAPDG